jgi:hypothetical protein
MRMLERVSGHPGIGLSVAGYRVIRGTDILAF